MAARTASASIGPRRTANQTAIGVRPKDFTPSILCDKSRNPAFLPSSPACRAASPWLRSFFHRWIAGTGGFARRSRKYLWLRFGWNVRRSVSLRIRTGSPTRAADFSPAPSSRCKIAVCLRRLRLFAKQEVAGADRPAHLAIPLGMLGAHCGMMTNHHISPGLRSPHAQPCSFKSASAVSLRFQSGQIQAAHRLGNAGRRTQAAQPDCTDGKQTHSHARHGLTLIANASIPTRTR